MHSRLRNILRVISFIGVIVWLFLALMGFFIMPLIDGDTAASYAGGEYLRDAAQDVNTSLPINLELARTACEKTSWTSAKLRQAYKDLELKQPAYLAQTITEGELRASIEEVIRQTEEEARIAQASRLTCVKVWLLVLGVVLIVLQIVIRITAPRTS